MRLRVQSISYLAEGINGYRLVDPHNRELPAFTSGTHIDIRLDNGLIRQYSLCGDPNRRDGYRIAVLNDPRGRGGSRYLHETVRVGQMIEVPALRNHFPLAAGERHLLLAGGIGITPMMSMIPELQRRGADFRLYYCTRTPAVTAFAGHLAPLVDQGRAFIHHDGGDPARGLDLARLLSRFEDGMHLYYCGPPGFMKAVGEAARDWPPETVHCEHFAAPQAEAAAEERPFRIRLAGTGEEFEVPVGQSIVGVLRRHGIDVETSCEEGFCGTCMTRYVGGEPDHRDQVLDEASRRNYVLICCARARTPVLELDL